MLAGYTEIKSCSIGSTVTCECVVWNDSWKQEWPGRQMRFYRGSEATCRRSQSHFRGNQCERQPQRRTGKNIIITGENVIVSLQSQKTSGKPSFCSNASLVALQRGNAVSFQFTMITEWSAVASITHFELCLQALCLWVENKKKYYHCHIYVTLCSMLTLSIRLLEWWPGQIIFLLWQLPNVTI